MAIPKVTNFNNVGTCLAEQKTIVSDLENLLVFEKMSFIRCQEKTCKKLEKGKGIALHKYLKDILH